MKFFLSGLSNFYDGLELVKTGVIEADKLGFDGALMADHYMWDSMGHMQFPKPNSTLDTWVTFTYLAAKTERIRLGTLVTPIPLRPPGILAKMLSTRARSLAFHVLKVFSMILVSLGFCSLNACFCLSLTRKETRNRQGAYKG